MQGLMMQQPLLVASLLMHAERHHGEQEIVSRRVEGDIHRYRYRDFAQRARRMANALAGLGIQPGERLNAKGAGLPPLHGGRRGDLVIAVNVKIPKKVNEAQVKLIRELAEVSGEQIPSGGGNSGILGGFFKRKK